MTNEIMLLNANTVKHIFCIRIIFTREERVQKLRKRCISLIIEDWHSSAILSLNRPHNILIKKALISSLLPLELHKSILIHRIRETLGGLAFLCTCYFVLFRCTLGFSQNFKTTHSYLSAWKTLVIFYENSWPESTENKGLKLPRYHRAGEKPDRETLRSFTWQLLRKFETYPDL